MGTWSMNKLDFYILLSNTRPIAAIINKLLYFSNRKNSDIPLSIFAHLDLTYKKFHHFLSSQHIVMLKNWPMLIQLLVRVIMSLSILVPSFFERIIR